MPLEILQNRYRIKLADDDFFISLFTKSEKFGECQVVYESFNGLSINYFYKNTNIYYIKHTNLWFSHIQIKNRSSYAFGFGIAKKHDSNIPTIVVDFSMEEIDNNCFGAFADNEGIVSVLLRVNYGKIRKQSIKGVLTSIQTIQAIEEDKKRYFMNLGQVNNPEVLENIEKLVLDIKSNLKHPKSIFDVKENEDNQPQFFFDKPSSNEKSYSKNNSKEPLSNLKDESIQNNSNSEGENESCVLCGKSIQDEELDPKIELLKNTHPDKCNDCLENIHAAKGLSEIKNLVSIKLLSEKSLLNKVKDPDAFRSYFKILKKLDLIKNFSKDVYIFNQTKDIDSFIEEYSDYFEVETDAQKIETKPDEPEKLENKLCEVCGEKLDLENFYKSDDSPDGYGTVCKECSRKSHAAKAIVEIRNYVDPGTPFNKEDLLKQSDNRMVFLDYFWTLQEFNLLEEDKKPDYYHLKSEKILDEFVEKYSDKSPEKPESLIEKTPEKKKTPKLAKTCEICNLKLPISDFFKTPNSEDGYSPKCKQCSRKSYAAKALQTLLNCVEPDVLFYQKDLMDQCENQIQFKDYCWTLQEFDLLEHDEQNDSYRLKPEDVVNEFISKYSTKTPKDKPSQEKVTPKVEKPYKIETTKNTVKICATCGETLPASNFYKSSSNEDGLLDNCKVCSEKTNASKILLEIQEHVEFGKPFTQNELSNKIDNETKANYYIWTLQEQNFLTYNEKTDTYVLEKNDKLEIVKNDETKIKSNVKSLDELEDTSNEIKEETAEEVSKTVSKTTTSHVDEFDQFTQKNIIYISDNDGSKYSTILLKGIIKNDHLIQNFTALEELMNSNMNKILVHRHLEHYSEVMIDLEIEKESIEETISLLNEANWINKTK